MPSQLGAAESRHTAYINTTVLNQAKGKAGIE